MSDTAVLFALATAMLGAGTLRAVLCHKGILTYELRPRPPETPEAAQRRVRREKLASRRVATALVAVLIATCAGLLAAGGVRWRQTFGRIDEAHTIGDYRVSITSERDPEWADLGENGEYIYVSVSHNGRSVTERVHVGAISDDSPPLTFNVRPLPAESLLIVTRCGDPEFSVMFVYNTATGETHPSSKSQHDEDYWKRREHFKALIRSALGDERYSLYCNYW